MKEEDFIPTVLPPYSYSNTTKGGVSLKDIPQAAGSRLDSDTIDGLQANTKPAPNALVALDKTSKFPTSVIPTLSASNLNIVTSAAQAITYSSALTVAHGKATKPVLITATLVCQTGEFGWSANDETDIASEGSSGISLVKDATNFIGIISTGIVIIRKDTYATATITAANWKIVFRGLF